MFFFYLFVFFSISNYTFFLFIDLNIDIICYIWLVSHDLSYQKKFWTKSPSNSRDWFDITALEYTTFQDSCNDSVDNIGCHHNDNNDTAPTSNIIQINPKPICWEAQGLNLLKLRLDKVDCVRLYVVEAAFFSTKRVKHYRVGMFSKMLEEAQREPLCNHLWWIETIFQRIIVIGCHYWIVFHCLWHIHHHGAGAEKSIEILVQEWLSPFDVLDR